MPPSPPGHRAATRGRADLTERLRSWDVVASGRALLWLAGVCACLLLVTGWLLFPAHAKAPLGPGETLLRRTWATRKPLWADRLACAWLIRRFVDAEATLVWLEKGEAPPPGALAYAYEGAHFAASEARVSYQEMLHRLGLAANPALAKIGGIVHSLEMRGQPVPEAAGVQTLLQGAQRRSASERELLGEAEKTFDLLYEAYYVPRK